MSDLKTIVAGIGLGKLKFGMSRLDVETLMGPPDEKEQYTFTNQGKDIIESWYYNTPDITLDFEEEDNWRLGTISVHTDAHFFGTFRPIGMEMPSLKVNLAKHGVTKLEFEDFASEISPTHQLLSSDKLSMNFWFDDGKVSQVQWWPFFLDEDTIKWPELN